MRLVIFSVLGMASVSDFGGSVNGLSMLGIDGPIEKRRVVLNLYLLSNVSPMLMLIRSAWSNYLLVRWRTTVDSEIFVRILFSRIALKDKLVI